MERTGLNRRDALRKIAAGGIGAAASAAWVHNLSALARAQADQLHVGVASTQSTARWIPRILNTHQHDTVAALVELIIPQTDTPGAKAVLVDRFVDSLLAEAQRPDRDRFVGGLAWLDRRSKVLFTKDFVTASPAQQAELLTKLSADGSTEGRPGVEFFMAIKAMTITGYYTSEVGLRDELQDDGRMFLAAYDGCTHPEHQG